MSKRRRVCGADENILQDEVIQKKERPSEKVYGDVTVCDNASAWMGDNHGTVLHQHYHYPSPEPNKYRLLLKSLTFDGMDARLLNVSTALPRTCQWLFEHETFRAWADENQVPEHHGFLWIKGKPGSGKSTIMKETVAWAKMTWPRQKIFTYFFNARSIHSLDKSALGLYRSLTHQLLTAFPNGSACFTSKFASKERSGKVDVEWTRIELQNFLIEFVNTGVLPILTVFVDALDEGDNDDVRDMISFFERLTEHATLTGVVVRLCLSSRHYPQISLRRGRSIVVESEAGHGRDILEYVNQNLAIGPNEQQVDDLDELRRRVCHRSAGIFLWVVLVVAMLKKLYDQGRTAATMIRRLDTVPQGLHEVFLDIISRDAEDIGECVTLLRWVLFSLRQVRPLELYVAVQMFSVADADTCEVPTEGTITRYLLSCSRGLIERTSARPPTVQFIHETVREFLIDKDALRGGRSTSRMGSELQMFFQADSCHAMMTEECLRYLVYLGRGMSSSATSEKNSPLAEYAARYWWQHFRASEKACRQRLSPLVVDFMANKVNLLIWIRHYNADRPSQRHKSIPTVDNLASPLYYAIFIGLTEPLNTLLEQDVNFDAQGGYYGNALQAAIYQGDNKTAHRLLDKGVNTMAEGGYYGTALQAACFHSNEKVVQRLLDSRVDINFQGGYYGSAIEAASAGGNENIVRSLLERGAELNNESGILFGNALCAASVMGRGRVVEILLLDGRLDINAKGKYYGSPLQAASGNGHHRIVQLLLEKEADVHAQGGLYGTALHIATYRRHWEVVKMLVDAGATA